MLTHCDHYLRDDEKNAKMCDLHKFSFCKLINHFMQICDSLMEENFSIGVEYPLADSH